MSAKVSSYKGNPTISLNPDSRFPFTFGLAKAKLILEHLPEIQAFVRQAEGGGGDRHDMAVEDRMADRCRAVTVLP